MKAKIVSLVPYSVTFEGKQYDKFYMLSVSPSPYENVSLFASLDKISASKAVGLKAGSLIDIQYRKKDGKRFISNITLLDKVEV